MFLTFQGRNKKSLEIESSASLSDLMIKAEEWTGIPTVGQKLICQAKTISSLDHEKTTLSDCQLTNGSKVMVLGRKIDPEKDEIYQKILGIEKRSLQIAKKLAEVFPILINFCLNIPIVVLVIGVSTNSRYRKWAFTKRTSY